MARERRKLLMIGGSNVFPPSEPVPHFKLTYGLHKRLAYLRSSNMTLPEREDFMKLSVSKGVRTAQGGAQTAASGKAGERPVFARFSLPYQLPADYLVKVTDIARLCRKCSRSGVMMNGRIDQQLRFFILMQNRELSSTSRLCAPHA